MNLETEIAEESGAARDGRFLERLDAPREMARNAVVFHAPRGLPAERYRLLDFRLGQLCGRRGFKTLGVASAYPGDGRSTTAMNLALSTARAGDRRVLLLEADLRAPSLGRQLGLAHGPGLSDVLDGSAGIENAVRCIGRPSMWVLPAGKACSGGDAAVLSPVRLTRILDLAKASFDCVYVDMPALLPTADGAIVASLCDGVVLVVRPRRSRYPALQAAAAALEGARVLGTILNDADGLLSRETTGAPGPSR